MSNNILKYRDYQTKIEYSAEDKVLFGKIEGIGDLVLFDSESASEIEKEFHNAVDGYLSFCKEEGKEPDKPYSGSFNVRINPELHRGIAALAFSDGISLNRAVENAIGEYINAAPNDVVNYCITTTSAGLLQSVLQRLGEAWNVSATPILQPKASLSTRSSL